MVTLICLLRCSFIFHVVLPAITAALDQVPVIEDRQLLEPVEESTRQAATQPGAVATPTIPSQTKPDPAKAKAFILSRNSTNVPAKLVAKITSLQFVDMRELLPDNIALSERLIALPHALQQASNRSQNQCLDSQRDVSSLPAGPSPLISQLYLKPDSI